MKTITFFTDLPLCNLILIFSCISGKGLAFSVSLPICFTFPFLLSLHLWDLNDRADIRHWSCNILDWRGSPSGVITYPDKWIWLVWVSGNSFLLAILSLLQLTVQVRLSLPDVSIDIQYKCICVWVCVYIYIYIYTHQLCSSMPGINSMLWWIVRGAKTRCPIE